VSSRLPEVWYFKASIKKEPTEIFIAYRANTGLRDLELRGAALPPTRL
jgi:hypothetical protein